MEYLTYPLDEISRDETEHILEELRAAGRAPSAAELRERKETLLARRPAEWWEQRDPLRKLKARALAAGLSQEDDLVRIREEVWTAVQEALEYARQSPYPEPAAVLDEVFRE